MSKDDPVIQWLRNEFLKHWTHFININKKFSNNESIPYEERTVLFPFIPIEADGYTLRNFVAFIHKYLFQLNPNFFIIILNNECDSILWAAFQKTESLSFTELIELDEHLHELTSFLSIDNKQDRIKFLKELLKRLNMSSELGFYLLLNIDVVSDFKNIYENHSNLLEFYSQVWDLMTEHFNKQTLQFYPEPLFFKFFRRLSTKNLRLNASGFEKLFGNLLPTQNLIITFLDDDIFSSLVIITKHNQLHIQVPNFDLLQNAVLKYKEKPVKGLEFLNKFINIITPVEINNRKVKASTAITITEDLWLMLQDIMTQYSFEHSIDRIFEMIKEVEEQWTVEQKIVLFRRWGKSFMEFQLQQLIPTQPTSIMTSVLSFLNEVLTRTVWFIVNDSLELLYILGIDFEEGQFRRIYTVPDQGLIKMFNSESDKTLAIKKAHLYFAEHDTWVNQIVAITAQDLNQLIAFLPLLTSIKGSLKYLKMIENIITYRIYFYPPNFFADIIRRKGATHFFKNIMFPLILKNNTFHE